MLHTFFTLEDRQSLGLKLKKVQQRQYRKGFSGLGL
jgi:hypothetical protein